MIVDLTESFFECDEDQKPDRANLIARILENRHYIKPRNGVIDNINNLVLEYGTRDIYELLSCSSELLSPSKRICEYLSTIVLSDYDELQLHVLLFKPSELLVENAPYEWNAYCRFVKAYCKDSTYGSVFQHIKRQIDSFNLVPANAGGYGLIPAMLNLKNNGEYYHLYKKKVCIVFDRDTNSGSRFDNNKNSLYRLLANKCWDEMLNEDVYKLSFGDGYIWHMWYRRAIENYFPISQYISLGVNPKQIEESGVDYNYYRFNPEDEEIGYKKDMMQSIGAGMSRQDFENGLVHFAIDHADYSEIQLLLLKIAKIV